MCIASYFRHRSKCLSAPSAGACGRSFDRPARLHPARRNSFSFVFIVPCFFSYFSPCVRSLWRSMPSCFQVLTRDLFLSFVPRYELLCEQNMSRFVRCLGFHTCITLCEDAARRVCFAESRCQNTPKSGGERRKRPDCVDNAQEFLPPSVIIVGSGVFPLNAVSVQVVPSSI